MFIECNLPEKVIHTRGKTFQPVKGKHVLKRGESHRCEVSTLGILACNFSMFFHVSQRDSFSKIAYRMRTE